jgi:hypothetical protein
VGNLDWRGVVRRVEKIVAVHDGLDEDKHRPEDQGHQPDALELQDRIVPAGSGLGEVRQNQRQRRQRA